MKRLIYTIILLSIFTNLKAEDDKTVTLITSGQGQTKDIAKQNALRNAIEQAFGAFISSRTEIVNDKLIKDEIISVSNGNIQKFDIISESALPDNLGYTVTIKSIVSVTKLTSFCESKGMQVEIKGALFAFNVIQKELSASNEKKVLSELLSIARKISGKMFDYTLVTSEFKKNNKCGYNDDKKSYYLPLKVNITINNNWNSYINYLKKTLFSLAMTNSEIKDYKQMGLKFFDEDILVSKNIFKTEFIPVLDPYYKSNNISISEDEFVWERALSSICKYNDEGVSSLKKFYDVQYSVYEKQFKKTNYEAYNLNFRTQINEFFEKLSDILKVEAFNYIILDQSGKEIIKVNPEKGARHERNGFKVFFGPVANTNKSDYGIMLIQKWITFKNVDFQSVNNDLEGVGSSWVLQQIKLGSNIGYAYHILFLNLEEIKSMSKLVVKHKTIN